MTPNYTENELYKIATSLYSYRSYITATARVDNEIDYVYCSGLLETWMMMHDD